MDKKVKDLMLEGMEVTKELIKNMEEGDKLKDRLDAITKEIGKLKK